MKHIAPLLSIAVTLLALPVTAYAATADTKPPATSATQKVELKDGSQLWTKNHGDAMISKDGGRVWVAAPDGDLETKDGSVITVKNGKKMSAGTQGKK